MRSTLIPACLALVLAQTGWALASDSADPFFDQWETYGRSDGLSSEKIMAVAADGQKVWVGTANGLALVQNGRVEVIDTGDRLPFKVVTALAVNPRNGDLWVGTMGGLARLSGGRIDRFTQLDSGLVNDVVYSVALDGDDLWVATAAGLNRYRPDEKVWSAFDTTNTLMHEPWCYSVTSSDGDIYVAVWGGGIIVRDRETGLFRQHRDPDGEMEIDLFRDDGLLHDVTSGIAVSNGIMWAATYFGLSRYDGRRWRSYGQDDSGLASDFINFVVADGDAVWIATDRGFSRFDSSTWHTWRIGDDGTPELRVTDPDGVSTRHALPSGPPSNTVFGLALARDGIWLATSEGLGHGISNWDIHFDTDTHPAKGETR